MRSTIVLTVIIGMALAARSYSVRAQQGRSANDGVYSPAQSMRGETVYADQCAACHDPMLTGGVGPALAGKDFLAAWKDQTVGDLFAKINNEMPLTAPGTLKPEQTADLVAFMLNANQFPAGTADLAADAAPLKDVKISEPKAGGAVAAAGAAGASLYAEAQSKRGEAVYTDMCAACHDPKLTGGVGPALAGKEFVGAWKDKPVGDLFAKIKSEMPLTAPGSLTPEQTADVVAFMLSANQYPAGAIELKSDVEALKAMPLGEPPQK